METDFDSFAKKNTRRNLSITGTDERIVIDYW